VWFLLAWAWVPQAAAQHCHLPDPPQLQGPGLQLGTRGEYGSFRTSRYEGEYLGLSLTGSLEHSWGSFHASLPAYRIVRNGLAASALGDLLLQGLLPLARAQDDSRVAGLVLAATAPTGDPDSDTGMGHFMLMPGLWGAWHSEEVFVQAQVDYGRAIGMSGTAHAGHSHGAGPIVNPMNASELEASMAAGYLLHPKLRVRAGVYGALPVGVDGGVGRAAVFLGSTVLLHSMSLGLEGHLPLAGAPFRGKVVLSLGALIGG
jgi:hypothetical protein